MGHEILIYKAALDHLCMLLDTGRLCEARDFFQNHMIHIHHQCKHAFDIKHPTARAFLIIRS